MLGDGNYLMIHALQLFTLAKVSIMVYGAVSRLWTSYTAPQFSLSDEFFLEISKSNTWALAESFDEPLALFCDTSVRHNIRVFSIGYLV